MCPDAHLLKTSAPGYKEEAVHSWYDFRNGECESADDEPILQTLESSRHEIQKIIKSEAGIVGIGNVFLGGVSQGRMRNCFSFLINASSQSWKDKWILWIYWTCYALH